MDLPVMPPVAPMLAKSVKEQGFRRLVIVNNHFEPEQVATLRAASEEAGALHLDLVRRRNAQRLTDEFRRGSCHAGRYETSLVLADAPALVEQATMAELPPNEVDMPAEMTAGHTDFLAMGMDRAYCGAPAENVDHVIPRSRGGPHTWDNVVAACRRCNSRKENRLARDAGMTLKRRPAAPKDVFRLTIGRIEAEWERYL